MGLNDPNILVVKFDTIYINETISKSKSVSIAAFLTVFVLPFYPPLKMYKSIVISFLCFFQVESKVFLKADGNSEGTYDLLKSVLGGTPYEVPDCKGGHESFGPHITQRDDPDLGRPVFVFHVHNLEDDDRCSDEKKQRVEIKVPPGGKNKELTGYEGDTVTFSWNFKLDPELKVSKRFAAIHQIKAKGGNVGAPLIDISVTKRDGPEVFEVGYTNRNSKKSFLASDDLSKFLGIWIHAREQITYGKKGKYSLVLTRLDSGETLMTVSKSNIDLWREGVEYVRPKWGIYRGKETKVLRDEEFLLDSFCLAKGTKEKCT